MNSWFSWWVIAFLLIMAAATAAGTLFANSTRRLQMDGMKPMDRNEMKLQKRKSTDFKLLGRGEKMAQKRKANRMSQFISTMMQESVPADFKPTSWSVTHNSKNEAIFAAAMYSDLISSQINQFCGTARKFGFKGDIVISVYDGTAEKLKDVLQKTQTIVYNVQTKCVGEGHEIYCTLYGGTIAYPINMLRYYFYKWWARMYDSNSMIMLSDFRDVMFQSNPFDYKKHDWFPPVAQFTVFQENHPIKVIDRCVFNAGWIESCYGSEALKKIGSNTVSCSGVSFGVKDAIMVYAELILQQLDEKKRYEDLKGMVPSESSNKRCISIGMDQGFHNWLVYSGKLEKYMDIKIFQQGEGPVNTVGAFGGARAVIKWPLETWGVVKGDKPNKYFYNWNGDKSPVVHQLDRFINSDFKDGQLFGNLGALQGF